MEAGGHTKQAPVFWRQQFCGLIPKLRWKCNVTYCVCYFPPDTPLSSFILIGEKEILESSIVPLSSAIHSSMVVVVYYVSVRAKKSSLFLGSVPMTFSELVTMPGFNSLVITSLLEFAGASSVISSSLRHRRLFRRWS